MIIGEQRWSEVVRDGQRWSEVLKGGQRCSGTSGTTGVLRAIGGSIEINYIYLMNIRIRLLRALLF